ncbi:MAG: hypothetical protein ACYCYA_09990 [Actinomycetes bacterium]
MGEQRDRARHRRLGRVRSVLHRVRVRGRMGTWALAVLAVALTATASMLGWQLVQSQATEHARRSALAAARASTPQILSYDYRHLGTDFTQAERDLTGAFKGEYVHTTQAVVTPAATRYQAVVKADVTAASVVSASPRSVVVLLFVDQTTTSNRLTGPKVDLNRVRMTLVPVGGRWLVSAVEAL